MDTLNISALPSQSEPVLTNNGQLLPQNASTISFGDAYAETATVINVNNEEARSTTLLRADNLAQTKTLTGPPAVLVEAIIDAISTALSIAANKKSAEEITRSTAGTASTGQNPEDELEVSMIVAQGVPDKPYASPIAETEPQATFGTITDPITPVHEFGLNQVAQPDNDITGTSKESDKEKQPVSLPLTEDILLNIAQIALPIKNDNVKQQDPNIKTAPVHTDTLNYIKTNDEHLYEVQHENIIDSNAKTRTFPTAPMPFTSLSSADENALTEPNTAPEIEFANIRNPEAAEPIFLNEVRSPDATKSEVTEIAFSYLENNSIRTNGIDMSSISNASVLDTVEHQRTGNISRAIVNIDYPNDHLTPNTAPKIYQIPEESASIFSNEVSPLDAKKSGMPEINFFQIANNSIRTNAIEMSSSSHASIFDTVEYKSSIAPTADQRDALPVPTNTGDKDIILKAHEAASINKTQLKNNQAYSLLTIAQNTDRNDHLIINKPKLINLITQTQSSDAAFDQSRGNAKKAAEKGTQQSKVAQLQIQQDPDLDIAPVSGAQPSNPMMQELQSNKNVLLTPLNTSVEELIILTKASDELIGPNLDLVADIKEGIERRRSLSMNLTPTLDGNIETSGHEKTQPNVTILRPPSQNIAPESTRDSKSVEISEDLRFRALERQVIAAARDGANQIRMQLYPPGIGQILIRLALDGSKLRLHIRTSSIEATNALNEMKDALRSAMDDAGFTITSLDVNDGNNDPNEDRKRERNHTTSQEIQSDHPEFSLELQA